MTSLESKATKRVLQQLITVPASNSTFVEVFMEIMRGQLTGSLTINFLDGNLSGTVEWKQKITIKD